MFRSKSKYYWDKTRNMSYEQAQKYLKTNKIKKIINTIKNKLNGRNTNKN
tara:strand:- start:11915 stop:12064 length:150 start_codon:yes stop_codon:yes gene_type:complete